MATAGTKNLGLVKAIHSGNSAPANTSMIWYNTLENRHYYHNGLNWVPFGTGGGVNVQIPHFVYRPNGITSGIVYSDFEEMMSAVDSTEGKKEIYFDRSLMADVDPFVIPPKSGGGAWNFVDTTWNWMFSSIYDTSNNVQIDVLDGNLWTRPPDQISFMQLTFHNTTYPVCTFSFDQQMIMFLNEACSIKNVGSVEAFLFENNAYSIFVLGEGSTFSNDAYQIISLTDFAIVNFALVGAASIQHDTVMGMAGAIIDVNFVNDGAFFDSNQPSFLGSLDFNSDTASRVMTAFLPNLGSVSLTHNFFTEWIDVQVWRNGGYPRVKLSLVSEITVQQDSNNQITIIDNMGMGGINIQAIINSINNQIG